MNQFIFKIADKIYQYIFGYPMGERARTFFENLGTVLLGSGTATLITFGVMILAGRWMGPAEYGKASIVFSVAEFLIIPMTLGLATAAMKYLPQEREKKRIVSTATYSVLVFSIVAFVAFYVLRDFVSGVLKIEKGIFGFALAYSLILALYYFSQAILRGLLWFRRFSCINLVSAFAFAALLGFLLFVTNKETFDVIVLSNMFGYGIFIIATLFFLKRFFGPFDKRWFVTLFSYGGFAMLGAFSGFILGNTDKLIINYFLGASAVGIYSAYYNASTMIISKGLQFFLIVFFPVMAGTTYGKKIIFKKIGRFWKIASVPFAIVMFLVIGATIFLFGKEYPLDFRLVALFSLNVVIFSIGTIFWWLIASYGLRGVKFTSINALIAALMNFLLNLILIQRFGLHGVLIATSISSLYFVLAPYYFFNTKVLHGE